VRAQIEVDVLEVDGFEVKFLQMKQHHSCILDILELKMKAKQREEG
jgi:hypothetical protein